MTPVTDPAVLEQLSRPGPKAVRDPLVLSNLEYGLDLTKPVSDIRARINQLPETEKKRANDLWAEHRVAQERARGFKPLPDPARGIPVIGPYLDEATALVQSGLNTVTAGAVGEPYDEALAYRRASNRAADAANPALSTIGSLAAGVATGGPLFSKLQPAATLVGRIGQGAAVGAGVGAAEGFGYGEGSASDRASTAADGAKVGAAIGGALPVAAAGLSRAAGAIRERLEPAWAARTQGPDAAADIILANRMAAEGSTPAQKRLDLQRGQAEAARLDSHSRANLPETLADTSDAMQRLTGSLYRQGGEAGNVIRQTLETRQRGPVNRFGSAAADAPQGQMYRIEDATERALLIRSANTARQTESQIMAAQKAEGGRLYALARQNSEAFDIAPVVQTFRASADEYPGPFRAKMVRAVNLFLDNSERRLPVDTIARFDAAKKALDDMIEQAQRSGQNNLTRELTGFKNNLLGAVHANGRNQQYLQARQAWGSAAENRQAIELGRAALREGSEVSIEQFRTLTEGQQRLFRLGFVESLRNAMSTKRPGNDITQLFQQRRVNELMSEIIPRSRGGEAISANRPERFGDLLRREERMVQTRNAALGNSATAQRQADDTAFAGDALAGMWSRFRQAPSLFNMGIEAVGVGIQRIFGYRHDVALALARRLLETDPQTRNQMLRRLQGRGSRDAMGRFAEYLDRSALAATGATASPMVSNDGGAGSR